MAQDTVAGIQTDSSTFGQLFDRTIQLATSRVGQVVAYFAAVTGAVVAFKNMPPDTRWMGAALISLPLLILVFQSILTFIERQKKKHLSQITGKLQTGYFSLKPREKEESFKRADDEHEQVLQWLKRCRGVLYLTGLSGTGKSSLLSAWVLPHLETGEKAQIVRLRGYQDPLTALQLKLLQPGVIWQKPSVEEVETLLLLERASRRIQPRRLVIVFDQFEEFVILQNPEKESSFGQFLSSLRDHPIEELTVLLVMRSDYIGLVEKLGLPPLLQDSNWKEVPSFTERAAQEFLQASGLEIDEKLLRDLLREAGEIERTKGLIRPITINLCGLVLARFTTGLPRNFRPGAMIPGFLRESILLPAVADVAPAIIPHLITSYVTKQPRSITDLARSTNLERTTVLGCLRRLGQKDRGIVRPLDAEQELWEISHDFLVPLVDSIVARWRASFWKKIRGWLPWITAACVFLAVIVQPTPTDVKIAQAIAALGSEKQSENQRAITFLATLGTRALPALAVPLRSAKSQADTCETLKKIVRKGNAAAREEVLTLLVNNITEGDRFAFDGATLCVAQKVFLDSDPDHVKRLLTAIEKRLGPDGSLCKEDPSSQQSEEYPGVYSAVQAEHDFPLLTGHAPAFLIGIIQHCPQDRFSVAIDQAILDLPGVFKAVYQNDCKQKLADAVKSLRRVVSEAVNNKITAHRASLECP